MNPTKDITDIKKKIRETKKVRIEDHKREQKYLIAKENEYHENNEYNVLAANNVVQDAIKSVKDREIQKQIALDKLSIITEKNNLVQKSFNKVNTLYDQVINVTKPAKTTKATKATKITTVAPPAPHVINKTSKDVEDAAKDAVEAANKAVEAANNAVEAAVNATEEIKKLATTAKTNATTAQTNATTAKTNATTEKDISKSVILVFNAANLALKASKESVSVATKLDAHADQNLKIAENNLIRAQKKLESAEAQQKIPFVYNNRIKTPSPLPDATANPSNTVAQTVPATRKAEKNKELNEFKKLKEANDIIKKEKQRIREENLNSEKYKKAKREMQKKMEEEIIDKHANLDTNINTGNVVGLNHNQKYAKLQLFKNINALYEKTEPIHYGNHIVRTLMRLYYIYMQKKYKTPNMIGQNEIILNIVGKERFEYTNQAQIESIEKYVLEWYYNTDKLSPLIFNVKIKSLMDSEFDARTNILIFTANAKDNKYVIVNYIEPIGGTYSTNSGNYTLGVQNLVVRQTIHYIISRLISKINTKKDLILDNFKDKDGKLANPNNKTVEGIHVGLKALNSNINVSSPNKNSNNSKNPSPSPHPNENKLFKLVQNDKLYKMPLFKSIEDVKKHGELSDLQRKLNPYEELIDEGNDYSEVWTMFLAEFALKYCEHFTIDQIYEFIYEKILLDNNRPFSQSFYLRRILLGYVNYAFNRVLKLYNIIFNKNYSSSEINKQITKFNKSQVLDQMDDPTVLESFVKSVELIFEYEKYMNDNPGATPIDFVNKMKSEIPTKFPDIHNKIKRVQELEQIIAKIEFELKEAESNAFKLQYEMQNKAFYNPTFLINKIKSGTNLIGKGYNTVDKYRLENDLSALRREVAKYDSYVNSLDKIANINDGRIRRNISSVNKTMKIKASSIHGLSKLRNTKNKNSKMRTIIKNINSTDTSESSSSSSSSSSSGSSGSSSSSSSSGSSNEGVNDNFKEHCSTAVKFHDKFDIYEKKFYTKLQKYNFDIKNEEKIYYKLLSIINKKLDIIDPTRGDLNVLDNTEKDTDTYMLFLNNDKNRKNFEEYIMLIKKILSYLYIKSNYIQNEVEPVINRYISKYKEFIESYDTLILVEKDELDKMKVEKPTKRDYYDNVKQIQNNIKYIEKCKTNVQSYLTDIEKYLNDNKGNITDDITFYKELLVKVEEILNYADTKGTKTKFSTDIINLSNIDNEIKNYNNLLEKLKLNPGNASLILQINNAKNKLELLNINLMSKSKSTTTAPKKTPVTDFITRILEKFKKIFYPTTIEAKVMSKNTDAYLKIANEQVDAANAAVKKYPDAGNDINTKALEYQAKAAVYQGKVNEIDELVKSLNEKATNLYKETQSKDIALNQLENSKSLLDSANAELNKAKAIYTYAENWGELNNIISRNVMDADYKAKQADNAHTSAGTTYDTAFSAYETAENEYKEAYTKVSTAETDANAIKTELDNALTEFTNVGGTLP